MTLGSKITPVSTWGELTVARQPSAAVGGVLELTVRKAGPRAMTIHAVGDRLYTSTKYSADTWAEIEVLITAIDASSATEDVITTTVLRGPSGITLPADTLWINKGPARSGIFLASVDGEESGGDDGPWMDARITGLDIEPWLTENTVLRIGNLISVLDNRLKVSDPQYDDNEDEAAVLIPSDPFHGIVMGWNVGDHHRPHIVAGRPDNAMHNFDVTCVLRNNQTAFAMHPDAAASGDAVVIGTNREIVISGDGEFSFSPKISDANIATMLFEQHRGVLLLGPHAALTSTTWTTETGVVAAITGGFRKVRGWWPGTTALVTLPSITTLSDNPGAEVDATGWDAYNLTIGRSSATAKEGSWSYELEWPSDGSGTLSKWETIALTQGDLWSVEMWAKVRDQGDGSLFGNGCVLSFMEWGGAADPVYSAVGYFLTTAWQRIVIEHEIQESDRQGTQIQLTAKQDAGNVMYIDAITTQPGPLGAPIIGSLPGSTWEGAEGASYSTSVITTLKIPDLTLVNEQPFLTVLAHVIPLHGWNRDGNRESQGGHTFWDIVGEDPLSLRYRCYLEDDTVKVAINSRVVLSYQPDWDHWWGYGVRLQVAATHNLDIGKHSLYVNGDLVDSTTVVTGRLTMLSDWYYGMSSEGTGNSALALYEYAVFHEVLQRDIVETLYLRGRPMMDRSALYVS